MQKLPRSTTSEELATLKSATRDSLKIVGGKRFSLKTRVGESALSEYGSAAQATDFMPVDILLDLQREMPAGVPSPLLEELAELAGFRLVALDHDHDDDPLSYDDVGAMIKEQGEASASALSAAQLPTCLHTIRVAKKEASEAITVSKIALRKLSLQERRLLRRAG